MDYQTLYYLSYNGTLYVPGQTVTIDEPYIAQELLSMGVIIPLP